MKKRRAESGGGGASSGGGAGSGEAADLIIHEDRDPPYFEFNGTRVFYHQLRPDSLNGEYPYLQYDNGSAERIDTFVLRYYPVRGYIEITARDMVEFQWPARLWPRIQPILDAQKRAEEVLDMSALTSLIKGGRSRTRRRSKRRSRSRRY